MFAQGTIDAEQLAAGTKSIVADLEDVCGQLQAAYSGSALDGIASAPIASAPDPGAAFLAADLDRQRLVVDALIEVTLLPSGKGRPKGWEPGQPYFRTETVSIEWKDR